MILIEDRNIVIITPPHTASRNIHRAMCRDAYWVIGPDPFDKDGINHHCTKIHKGWHRRGIAVNLPLKVYIICRDPYTRLVGLFLHYEWAQKHDLAQRYLCWEEFVYNRNNLGWIFNKTIAEFINASGIEEYEPIKYERLEENLSGIIQEKVELPSKYHDLIDIKEWYYDPKLLKHVNETWSSEDCELFDYPKIEVV
tara:strand:+ start:253 stop:843 length:591 start_codon:yes stop_codon:yes gene_type:complete